jgi:hypothetical protein
MSKDSEAALAVLKTKSILAAMPTPVLEDLVQRGRRVTYSKGQQIYLRGDIGDSLLIVLKGRVKISNIAPTAREIVLNILGTGDLVGELGVLDGELRSADAAALEACEGLLLYRRESPQRDFSKFDRLTSGSGRRRSRGIGLPRAQTRRSPSRERHQIMTSLLYPLP